MRRGGGGSQAAILMSPQDFSSIEVPRGQIPGKARFLKGRHVSAGNCSSRTRRGFTLIELLVVVAIIGIIVAVAIPNLLNALQRAKQKKSMGDMRTLALAIEAYTTDVNRYPAAAGFALPSGLALPTAPVTAIQGTLTPTYLKTLPLTDGWSSWFTYSVSADGSAYALRSNGADGAPDAAVGFGPTTRFNSDIILCDGQFVQYPEGVQK